MDTEFDLGRPVDLALTLGPLRHGRSDPTVRISRTVCWRATRTPHGPATVQLLPVAVDRVRARAWGPGAEWALARVPALLGSGDDDSGFVAHHQVVHRLRRELPGLRIGRSGAVLEALVPAIVEQKVTGLEARRAYAALVRGLGEPAPGPVGPPGPASLFVPPSAAALAGAPSWAYHRFGIERRRAETIRRAAGVAARLEECTALPLPDARRRLQAIAGIGPWTAAEVALSALGDADAVSIGDYHIPHQVAYALAGETRGDDRRMLELLEPYRGHRGRVLRLLACGGITEPRFGPRLPARSIADL